MAPPPPAVRDMTASGEKVRYGEVNAVGIRRFLSAWDPSWRWVLLLGMRELRADTPKLGRVAAERHGDEGFAEAAYTAGPVATGITAAALNETALHCEDLFALLKFIRSTDFVGDVMRYSAGGVTRFGEDLAKKSRDEVRRLFLFPDMDTIRTGLDGVEDIEADLALIDEHLDHLYELVQKVVSWYVEFKWFHVQYKHGLKVALRPFGTPTDEAVAERLETVTMPLFAFSNETITEMMKRPLQQQGMMMFDLDNPAINPHINRLVEERRLLRYQSSGKAVDLDELIDLSWEISRLLRCLIHNCVALLDGLGENSIQAFELPGIDNVRAAAGVALQLEKPLTIQAFR